MIVVYYLFQLLEVFNYWLKHMVNAVSCDQVILYQTNKLDGVQL